MVIKQYFAHKSVSKQQQQRQFTTKTDQMLIKQYFAHKSVSKQQQHKQFTTKTN